MEIEALRQAFEETHNVSSAISIARERGSGPSSPARLRSALRRFDELEADRILEESLAVRSVERTVEEVLLPAIDGLRGRESDLPSAEHGFAWRWAWGWLAAAKRVAPPPTRSDGVLIFDASATCEIDALHAQGLELFLRRAGVRTLMLTAELDPGRLAHVLQVLNPRLVVLTGRRSWVDALTRIAYQSRRAGVQVEVLDFRGAVTECDATIVPRLGPSAIGARDLLLTRLNARENEPRARPALAQIS